MLGIFPSRRRQTGGDGGGASSGVASSAAEGGDPTASSHSCESCRSAPGIPFCRVEWSFLCSGCAAFVHGHNWVISVSPNPSPNPSSFPYPSPYPYFYPNPSSVPNYVANLCTDGGTEDIKVRKRGRKRGRPVVFDGRMESVIRYREKRESRNFEKTVRYENRKVDAKSRPGVDGKFLSRKEDGGGEDLGLDGDGLGGDRNEEVGMDRNEEVRLLDGEVEVGREPGMDRDIGLL